MNTFEDHLRRNLGDEAYARIAKVKVGIAGLGGLGSNVAANLVRCGFRRLVLCDFDKVTMANIDRQFYFLDQLDLPKVYALRTNLLRINPWLQLTVLLDKITEGNVEQMFDDCDVVVEAFDDAQSKRMIAQAYGRSGKLFVGASGLAGWGPADEIITHRIHDFFYLIGDLTSAVTKKEPALSPRVNVAAAKQANVILDWALSRS